MRVFFPSAIQTLLAPLLISRTRCRGSALRALQRPPEPVHTPCQLIRADRLGVPGGGDLGAIDPLCREPPVGVGWAGELHFSGWDGVLEGGGHWMREKDNKNSHFKWSGP